MDFYGYTQALPRQTSQQRLTVITSSRGDVNGDGFVDNVYLAGNKTAGSPLWQNITLIIENTRTRRVQRVPMKNNVGYNPTIFLGDFSGNKVDDIFVVIDSGGSGGMIYAYLFSDWHGRLLQMFDSDAFNDTFKYQVHYLNQFKALVISDRLQKKYILDLTYKGKAYLEEIYNPDGTLKQPIEGWVDPLSGLYPVDFDRDGSYELEAYQQISGRYHADGLGYVVTVLKWNGRTFVADRQNVSIFGGKL